MSEKRKFSRLNLVDLSARLFHIVKDSELEVDYSPINVSEQGMSIFTSSNLPVGERYRLELDSMSVELEVRWCQAKVDDPGVFRSGLKLVDSSYQLAELVKKHLDYE